MKNVPRYDVEQSIQGGKPMAHFKLVKKGQWIHFSDIEELLKSTPNTASLKLRVLVELLKSRPVIDTTCVLKVLYKEFPQLQA